MPWSTIFIILMVYCCHNNKIYDIWNDGTVQYEKRKKKHVSILDNNAKQMQFALTALSCTVIVVPVKKGQNELTIHPTVSHSRYIYLLCIAFIESNLRILLNRFFFVVKIDLWLEAAELKYLFTQTQTHVTALPRKSKSVRKQNDKKKKYEKTCKYWNGKWLFRLLLLNLHDDAYNVIQYSSNWRRL